MPIPLIVLSASQAQRLLALNEGHFLDLKGKRIAPSRLTRAMSAFANADGGELFIGIEDAAYPGVRWDGFENPEAANGHLQPFEDLFPLGQDFTYQFLQCDEQHGLILHVTIQKTREIKSATDGQVYLRRGAQNLPVDTAEKLARLKLNKGITSFELEAVGVNLEEVTNSSVIIKFLLEVVPTAGPENWLRKQQLIRDAKPLVGAVLLFAEEPQAILPKRCGVKVYRYKTTHQDQKSAGAEQWRG